MHTMEKIHQHLQKLPDSLQEEVLNFHVLTIFFIWTILALGVTALFSLILSARGLWSLRRGQRAQ